MQCRWVCGRTSCVAGREDLGGECDEHEGCRGYVTRRCGEGLMGADHDGVRIRRRDWICIIALIYAANVRCMYSTWTGRS